MNRRRLLALALPLLLAVCAGFFASARARPSARRAPGLNVLLVTIDTLRADALGSYGNRAAATPVLDRLAAAGVRFERARAHNVVTLPSHANILSGRYPFEHGLRDNAGYRFPAGLDTIATLLKRRGYRTGAFVSAFPLDSRFGLDRGFDLYDDQLGDPERVASFRMTERAGALTVAAARRFIDREPRGPWFCWVHLYEPHAPYEPQGALAVRFAENPYEGEVAAADEALAPLLGPLLSDGGQGHTLVIVTSDHGESLGEHGEKTHGVFAYDATLRVPLILFAPEILDPRVVSDPVRHVDILPTVMDALGAPIPSELPGRSLLTLAAGKAQAPETSYFEALTASANRGWAPLHGVVRDERKYIDLPLPELYDLRTDPSERANLVASSPAAALTLKGVLSALLVEPAAAARQTESADTRERLRSLGYLSASAEPRDRYGADDDPKRLIGYESRLEELVARQAQGDQEGARAVGRELVRGQPDSPLVLLHVASLEHDAGQVEKAITLLEHALTVSPEETQASALLGRYLTEAGRPAEAVRRLSRAAARAVPDVDVLMTVGAARAQTGDLRGAYRELGRARDIDPTNALCWLNLGTVHLMAGDTEAARAAFLAALEREPGLARAHTSLGVIEARGKHTEAALEQWKRALELNPAEYDALFNAGTLLLQEGRRDEGMPFLARFAREAPPALYAADIQAVKRILGRAGDGRG
jgi:arylsulfatase A-like enzyme/Tfp pilus assembly protein PilF